MIAIRAHFDGRVIVPDEPVLVDPDTEVIVLLESAGESPKVDPALEEATRLYYQERSAAEVEEDEEWGRAIAEDSKQAWE